MTTGDKPRIYVACLASYNAGELHGAWLDATADEDTIKAEIATMLAASPEEGAEEYAIHDYDHFYNIALGEYEAIETVIEVARLLEEHGAVAAALYGICDSVDRLRTILDEHYAGVADALGDWVHEYLEGTGLLGQVPEPLRHYLDLERYGQDLELDGSIVTIRVDGKLHIFWTT